MSGNYITNASAKGIALVVKSSATLTYLSLSNCKLQDVGLHCILESLNNVSTLIHLNLSSNRMNNASASMLSNVIKINLKLHHLDLSKCMLKEEGLVKISESLRKSLALKYIDLSFNDINTRVAQNLVPALKKVSQVFFNNCNLQTEALEKISSVLEMSSSIQELGLSETSAMTTQATILSRNINVKYLCISSCILAGSDFKPILRATEFSSSIKYLDASKNAFDNETSRKLGECLYRQKFLQNLQIFKCSFSKGGLKCIFKGLQGNKQNFYHLNTSSNNISSETAIELSSTITSNPKLKHLILHHCDLQEQGLIMISNALRCLFENIECKLQQYIR